MNSIARNWRVVVGGVAAGSAALIGFAGTTASAEPTAPAPSPAPAPVTVTQTVTVTPQAAAAQAPAAQAPGVEVPVTVAATPAAAPVAAPVAAPAAAPVAAPAAAPVAALPPATSGTLAEFFKEKGVELEPQKAAEFTALNIVLPMPTGWSVVPDPNVPDAFTVTADRKNGDGLYSPNAQLFVSKLVGDFDPREAISHGYVDSQKLLGWQSTAASMADFGGFPSSVIGGTYREGDVMLNTSRRHLIAQAGEDRYLVSLFVTTSANQVVANAPATDAIVNGFKVTVPGATPVAAAPLTAASAPLPAAAAPAAPPAAPVLPLPAAAIPVLPQPAAPAPVAVPVPAPIAPPAQ